jgi:putative DNA methylase
MTNVRLIETNDFPFEFLSQIAERESWRKEVHRPIYHVHKWWAKRLGSVFRGILLGCALPRNANLTQQFYSFHNFSGLSVFDPFMGSGTTIGEAHKLGFTTFGQDINPVAVESARVAFGPMDRNKLSEAFTRLTDTVGRKILSFYRSIDSTGRDCDVLYYFWVMQAPCPNCGNTTDLFPSWVIAKNAYPNRKPQTQILCPNCGDIFCGLHGQEMAECRSCKTRFSPHVGTAKGAKATCSNCQSTFSIISAVGSVGRRPNYRLYGKLVLTEDGTKEYLPATQADLQAYKYSSRRLAVELDQEKITLPELKLEDGYNTKQAISYGFRVWTDFFNDRQLLALGLLQEAIAELADQEVRDALLTIFSGTLEFNNLFASYKGEGTGAVRHMFSHHILKPERMPIEANVWGTPKSSGSFSNLFRNRILRAIEYRLGPTEVNGKSKARGIVCSMPFSGNVEIQQISQKPFYPRGIHLSCGDSAATGLPSESIDFVVTDPPFFDNVHYSELADFFYAWQQMIPRGFVNKGFTTRSESEVQDTNADSFAKKLQSIFQECHRVLKNEGILVFTYHHSREDGWKSLINAIFESGFVVVNAHPVKAEMSVATPKSQANDPIQLDTVIVCKKSLFANPGHTSPDRALEIAWRKLRQLEAAGFCLSRNDQKVVLYGQLLTSLETVKNVELVSKLIEEQLTTSALKDPKDLFELVK